MQAGRAYLIRRLSSVESRNSFTSSLRRSAATNTTRSYRNSIEADRDHIALIKGTHLIQSMASSTSADASGPQFTNKLAKERSPYLLQHAHNPVEWYPWGDEALQKAKKENKLIFLSIGYSTCHWCHVMEHESFENESVAQIMNQFYINIKIDREERPDIDSVYMTYVQLTTGRGGWPMSLFLTPDLQPILGGTYYPPEDRYGHVGFKSILLDLAKKWTNNREMILERAYTTIDILQRYTKMDKSDHMPSARSWKSCVQRYIKEYEPEYGGFGSAPKFPQPSIFNFLFHAYARDKDSDLGKKCLNMCLYTLKKMANGGIHDHVSNGFARYSVDDKWHVPHFEKMLYDQAQLAVAYTDAYLATKEAFYSDIVKDILLYVNRDLSHQSGGFYSAEDADSYPKFGSVRKLEGAFCVWDYSELNQLLNNDKTIKGKSYFEIYCHHFDIKKEGNVDLGHGAELDRKNILIIYGSPEETADKFSITVEELNQVLEECRAVLYEARQKRPRPHLDSKMICSWNGLMIAAYSKAGQALGDKAYIERAVKAADCIKSNLYDPVHGTLLRSCYRDEAGNLAQISSPIQGFLNDYAFLIKGLLDLYEASLNGEWLEWANNLQDKQDELFWDDEENGYYTSTTLDKSVVLRLKEDTDGAEPSGNSVSAHNLIRLGAFGVGDDGKSRRDRAEKLLAAFSQRLEKLPTALPEMVSALMFHSDSPTQVFIAGGRDDPRTLALLSVVRARLLPGRIVAVAEPGGGGNTGVSEILLSRIRPLGGVPAAYVCRHYACSLPVTEVSKLEELLDKKIEVL